MMKPVHPMQSLFEQLGLLSSTQDIDLFITEHMLMDSMKLHEADFWSPAQAQFLKEGVSVDADWAEVIDELNSRLHQ